MSRERTFAPPPRLPFGQRDFLAIAAQNLALLSRPVNATLAHSTSVIRTPNAQVIQMRRHTLHSWNTLRTTSRSRLRSGQCTAVCIYRTTGTVVVVVTGLNDDDGHYRITRNYRYNRQSICRARLSKNEQQTFFKPAQLLFLLFGRWYGLGRTSSVFEKCRLNIRTRHVLTAYFSHS